jgi:hypothetical protein
MAPYPANIFAIFPDEESEPHLIEEEALDANFPEEEERNADKEAKSAETRGIPHLGLIPTGANDEEEERPGRRFIDDDEFRS